MQAQPAVGSENRSPVVPPDQPVGQALRWERAATLRDSLPWKAISRTKECKRIRPRVVRRHGMARNRGRAVLVRLRPGVASVRGGSVRSGSGRLGLPTWSPPLPQGRGQGVGGVAVADGVSQQHGGCLRRWCEAAVWTSPHRGRDPSLSGAGDILFSFSGPISRLKQRLAEHRPFRGISGTLRF